MSSSSLKQKLNNHTSFFGIRLWILILAFTALFLIVFLIILYLSIIYHRRRKKSYKLSHFNISKNPISQQRAGYSTNSSLDRRLLSGKFPEIDMTLAKQWSTKSSSTVITDLESAASASYSSMVPDRGNRLSLKEIEMVTNGFAEENVITSGVNAVVYRAVLLDNTRVAVKKLQSYSISSAEEFIREVEVIGNIRHKNLVKLLGYCVDEYHRILVYEYIDNGNLHQWLHGDLGEFRPLTWGTRMKIIQGIAKGLSYLHEDIDPKIVHQNIKSSNILLDQQWNPKISDVGLSNLHSPEWSRLSNLEMRKSGYGARENDSSTGYLSKKSYVYGFGVLIMEIVSGRIPQVYLIDWLKSMVSNHKIEYVMDPKLPEIPAIKELKRVVLVALRCVDPDVKHRPKMADVILMLQPHGDLLLHDKSHITRQADNTLARTDDEDQNSSDCNQEYSSWENV